jgi:hypothetical protein
MKLNDTTIDLLGRITRVKLIIGEKPLRSYLQAKMLVDFAIFDNNIFSKAGRMSGVIWKDFHQFWDRQAKRFDCPILLAHLFAFRNCKVFGWPVASQAVLAMLLFSFLHLRSCSSLWQTDGHGRRTSAIRYDRNTRINGIAVLINAKGGTTWCGFRNGKDKSHSTVNGIRRSSLETPASEG